MLAAYRLLLATFLLLPVFLRDFLRYPHPSLGTMFTSSLLPGVVLGLHFITWVIGARMTPGANATLIVSLVPLVMPIFMFFLYQEGINRREVLATVVALTGMIILSAGDFSINKEHLIGDIVCLVSMILFGFYLALGRNSAKYESIWLYLIPMYLVAGVFCFFIALFYSSPLHEYSNKEITMIVGLAVVPTVIGHSLLNYSMQKFRGQTVSIVNMGQFIIAGIVAYFLYQEIPATAFFIASILFLFSIWLIIGQRKTN